MYTLRVTLSVVYVKRVLLIKKKRTFTRFGIKKIRCGQLNVWFLSESFIVTQLTEALFEYSNTLLLRSVWLVILYECDKEIFNYAVTTNPVT